jgi:isopenicillin-N epimerase
MDVSRRAFLRHLSATPAAVAALAELAGDRVRASFDAVRQAAAGATSEAAFWRTVRGEFLIGPGLAFMNNGTLGPTPKPVFYTLVDAYYRLACDPSASEHHAARADEIRAKAAAFVGADPDEIALTRNTTEGMSFVANGLDLKAGDEVLLTFHEHPGGLQPWRLKAKRVGIEVKQLPFPIPLARAADVLNTFADAITPRTRVISVSHATYPTGTFMPVKALCELAHARGILVVVDGAHPLGMMRLDLHDLGCDVYATSPHKWLDAPDGTGLLYVRREVQERLWPTVATTGWDDEKSGARRFDRLSQRGWPQVLAVGAAMDFQNAIGRDRIEARVRALAARLRAGLEPLPGVRIHTSAVPELCCGLTGFAFGTYKNKDVVATLRQRHNIVVRSTEFDLNTVRVSTHHYTLEEEVDRLIEGLEDILKRGVIPAPAEEASEASDG